MGFLVDFREARGLPEFVWWTGGKDRRGYDFVRRDRTGPSSNDPEVETGVKAKGGGNRHLDTWTYVS